MVRETNLAGGISRTASRAWATASSALSAADWTSARRAAWRRSWGNQNKPNASLTVVEIRGKRLTWRKPRRSASLHSLNMSALEGKYIEQIQREEIHKLD